MLFDAVATGDCVICLQPLLEGPSAHNTPQKDARGRPSSGSTPVTASSTFMPAGAVPQALAPASTGSGFHVSFAAGVLRHYDDFVTGQPTSTSALSSSAAMAAAAEAEADASQRPRRLNEVTLLPCGHGFFHYGCILQLYEYSQDSKCPVCRAPIRSLQDLIPFHPRSRPSQVENARLEASAREFHGVQQELARTTTTAISTTTAGRHSDKRSRPSPSPSASPSHTQVRRIETVDSDNSDAVSTTAVLDEPVISPVQTSLSDNSDKAVANKEEQQEQEEEEEEDEEGEILLVGSRQVDPSEAYCGLLERITRQYEERAANVHDRGANLRTSLKELEEDCYELQRTIADCRRRKELLGDHSDGQRLIELRRTCVETRQSSDSVARELASAIRENAELQRQIDKFKRKSERLQPRHQ